MEEDERQSYSAVAHELVEVEQVAIEEDEEIGTGHGSGDLDLDLKILCKYNRGL